MSIEIREFVSADEFNGWLRGFAEGRGYDNPDDLLQVFLRNPDSDDDRLWAWAQLYYNAEGAMSNHAE